MYVKTTIAAAILALAPTWAVAQDATDFSMYGDLEWMPMAEGSPAEISVLWGDMAAGPAAFLIRLPPGFDSGLHAHHSDYRGVIIRGTHSHWDEGQDAANAPVLGPGDSWFQPKDVFHGDANRSDGEVLGLVLFDGPVDSYVKE